MDELMTMLRSLIEQTGKKSVGAAGELSDYERIESGIGSIQVSRNSKSNTSGILGDEQRRVYECIFRGINGRGLFIYSGRRD